MTNDEQTEIGTRYVHFKQRLITPFVPWPIMRADAASANLMTVTPEL